MSEQLTQNEPVEEYIRKLLWRAVEYGLAKRAAEHALANTQQLEQGPEPLVPQVERSQSAIEMTQQCDPEHLASEVTQADGQKVLTVAPESAPSYPEAQNPSNNGEWPFKCDFVGCSKLFTNADTLKSHSPMHEGYQQLIPKDKNDIDNLSKVVSLNGKLIKFLRVIDLKRELGKRNLPKHGKQRDLIHRLTKYLQQNPHECDPKGPDRVPNTTDGGSSAPNATTFQQGQVINSQ